MSNLAQRVASAAVMVPSALATAYWGGWPFLIFWAIAALLIFWEWMGLVGRSDARTLAPGALALVIAFSLTGLGWPGAGAAMVAVGAGLAGIRAGEQRVWAAAGVVYASVAFFGPVLLRRDTEIGFIALVFLFAVVWATDILAYFVGRAVGGPLLWPRLSPKKTWSGAVGGAAGAVAASVAVAYADGIGNLAAIGVLGLLLSVLSQAGDLLESAVKRHFRAKDASQLIPGHGGLMDRLDGFLIAALAGALIGILRQGVDAPAHGLLLW